MENAKKTQDRLYHIRILRTYLEYIKNNRNDIDINQLLDYAGISRSEVDDDGFWYTQEQSDRFHEILDKLTGKGTSLVKSAVMGHPQHHSVQSGSMSSAC